MKKIQLSRHEIPFQLDQHYRQDSQLVLSVQDEIMFVENTDGEVLHTFEASEAQIDWLDSFPDYRYIDIVPEAQVAVVMAKELANTSIPLPKHVGDDETVYLSLIDDRLEISSEYHDQTVAVTPEIRADFDKLAGGCPGCSVCGNYYEKGAPYCPEPEPKPNLLEELPPAGPCSCLYGPNPGYNEHGEYGGYCENCGDLIR
jgi:hypothetical protein